MSFIKHVHAFQRLYLGTMHSHLPCLTCCTHVSQHHLEIFGNVPVVPVPRCCLAVYPSNFFQVTFHIPPSYNNDQSNFLARSGQVALLWSKTPMVQVKVITSTQVDGQIDYIICHKRECEQLNPPETKLAEYILLKQIQSL